MHKYAEAVALHLGGPASAAHEFLEALTAAGVLPTDEKPLDASHVARIILASGTAPELAASQAEARSALKCRAIGPWPRNAGELLTLLVQELPHTTSVGEFDLRDGFIVISNENVTLDCKNTNGNFIALRYGADFAGVTHDNPIPISTVQVLAKLLRTSR